mgnify:CR=1 FL=1
MDTLRIAGISFTNYALHLGHFNGAKAFILKVVGIIVKLTPSKEDDKIVAELKKILKKF